MWKNFGGVQPNARYSSTCFGVEDIHSSARITWRDLHQVIVDHVREVIRRQAIRLEQHLIVDVADVARLLASRSSSFHVDRPLERHREAHDERLAGRGARIGLGRHRIAAEPVVAGSSSRPPAGPASSRAARACRSSDSRRRSRAASPRGPDRSRALALAIRGMRATDIGAFVPRQAEPVQRIEDHLLGLGACAGLVGVLDPEDEFATLLLGEDVVEQRDLGGPDVRVTGRRWCNSHTHGRHSAALLTRHGNVRKQWDR